MSALFHTPLSAPRQFVGTVDATHDTGRSTARCLEQLQGNQRSSTAEIVPMGAPQRMHFADRLVTAASACAAAALAVILATERFLP